MRKDLPLRGTLLKEGAAAPVSLGDVLENSDEREVSSAARTAPVVEFPSPELMVWGLFSAGGMVAAFLIPVHVAIIGIAWAAGWLPAEALSYDRAIDLARHPLTRIYLGLLTAMPLYHWAHRFRYAVHHQFGVHGWRRLVATLCYGTAVAGTAVTIWVLVLL
ncbi:MAG: fumarate reductase subunit FrdD [Actinomycetota bacterium]